MHKAWKIAGGLFVAVIVGRLIERAFEDKPPAPTAVASSAAATQVAAMPAASPLPEHAIVDDSPLPPRAGHRVEIRVAALPTMEDCQRLVDAYRRRAAPDGQVTVSVRVRDKSGESDLPVCVENFDGKGPSDGMAGAMLRAMKGAEILPLPPH